MSKKEIEPRIDTYCEQQRQVKTVLAGKGIEFDYDNKNNMYIKATAEACGCTGDNGITVKDEVISLDSNKFTVSDTNLEIRSGDDKVTTAINLNTAQAILGAVNTETGEITVLGVSPDGEVVASVNSDVTNVFEPVTAGDNVTIEKTNGQYKISASGGGGASVSVDGQSITKNGQNQIQAVAVKDVNDNTVLTAEILRKACTIRRYK